MVTVVCQTCGDIGFEEALVYCDSCKIEAIHRYCVGITPTPFTECITWICEDCDASDCDCDSIEVDQTAKIGHGLVEYHWVQDDTNVEPVEVSSSSVTETMKESKRRESSVNGNVHDLTAKIGHGLVEYHWVQDDNSGTSKRSDSGFDGKEVDQTDKLRHMSKKKKKKTNREKNSKNSSSHTPPVLVVEDHRLHDDTNVEPVKVSASPIEETTKESKKRERSDSGRPHELTGLARIGASVSGVEKSSTVLDDSSCTSKRNNSGSDCKEVDQTANLSHILKRSAKRKKKKKNKKSSNRSPPVLAVEDHGLQDDTNVEPVKVSASPIKETTKESKKRERSDSGRPHELTGLARNVASVSGVGNSSTVLDDSSCTSKRNNSGSDCKEVDQTANLSHILKKSEKRKKKKKTKKSSNRSQPVLAVEDHGFKEATNVEPVEVSSSPVKETMESKRQESSDRRKPRELTGLVQNGASVSEAQNSSSVPDDSSSTSRKRKLSPGNIPLTSENKRLAGGNSSCKEAELNMPRMSERLTSRDGRAEPIKIPIWRGLISVKGRKNCSMDGIDTHVSSVACPKVHETASLFRGRLSPEMSTALVALSAEAASLPMPKLKNISQLRTEHEVYELPDKHPLVFQFKLERREFDDPCSYLLAIWTPGDLGETADSVQPAVSKCISQANGKLCDEETCFSCLSIKEARSQIVRGTILIPCRTAMRGSFPLNGTYFQVNEVFADHASSLKPIDVPRDLISDLPRRTVYFGSSIPTIFKGLPTDNIQQCFWKGYVCVRGFDRKTRRPKPLIARLLTSPNPIGT